MKKFQLSNVYGKLGNEHKSASYSSKLNTRMILPLETQHLSDDRLRFSQDQITGYNDFNINELEEFEDKDITISTGEAKNVNWKRKVDIKLKRNSHN